MRLHTVLLLAFLAFSTAACDGGADACVPLAEVCNGVDDDCDGLVDEEPAASASCPVQGGHGTCTGGACAIGSCEEGLDDCDAEPSNGCESALTSVDHCGACDVACDFGANTVPACESGACAFVGCAAGFEDCNADPSDGCEHDAAQGGACVCEPGSTAACYTGPEGTLGVGTCTGGTATCNPDGLGYAECEGEVLPSMELCANGVDEDCNGVVDDVPDEDGDGWTRCDGDCCETVAECAEPAKVNPGAFEIMGNGVDDDCDPATSDLTPPPACSTSPSFTDVTALTLSAAMEVCQTTTTNPPLAQKKWGLINAQLLEASGSSPSTARLTQMENEQAAVLAGYGTGGVVPQVHATMAGLSTGRMRDKNDPGYVAPVQGTDFGHDGNPPAVYLAANGGQFPSSQGCNGNCSAGSGANDSVNLRLTLRVPTNASSFSYRYRFFSSEYWTYSCTAYNDFHLALLDSTHPAIPADRNIAFDTLGNPVSVNNGLMEACVPKGCYSCPLGSQWLAGTGMEDNSSGAGTSWQLVSAPVVPGETITLDLMVFDVSDNILDSLVLLDGFQWNP